MNKKIYLVLIITILLTGIISGCINQVNENSIKEEVTATVKIDFGNQTIKSYNITTKNNTVYGFLLEAAKKGGYNVNTTYYGTFDSIFIDSIANIENGDDNKFWVYYINEQSGSVGADKQKVENDDLIEWKFETYT
jgi:hypothetical protein